MLFHLDFLGCRLNEAEIASWKRQLHQHGHRLVQGAEDADVIILNTCAVTSEASKKSRQRLRKLNRQNPKAGLVVTGCYASLEPQKMAETLGVNLVVQNKDKDQLIDKINKHFSIPTPSPRTLSPDSQIAFSDSRTRAFIKVQDGCHNRCSFCIVSKARGAERSRSISSVIQEVQHLQDIGFQEVILTGVHLGGYGRDIQSSLVDLIEHLLKETDIPRIRIGSLEPWELNDNFFALFAHERLCPHLHLPLQSASNSVLKRMIRKYTIEEYSGLVSKARSVQPDMHVSTDVIVAFPGETETEFKQGLEHIQALQFGDIHIFRYSPREGTAAARLPNRVPKPVAVERYQMLRSCRDHAQKEFQSRFIGRVLPVLWERNTEKLADGQWLWHGYTHNYIRTHTVSQSMLFNKLTPTLLKESTSKGVLSSVLQST